MALILPLVKKYDAAIIALPNDADEIPMEADKRLELVAARSSTSPPGVRHRRSRTSSSTRWPCRSAPTPTVVNTTLETMRRIRDEYGAQHDLRRLQRVVRHARPAHPRRGVPADGDDRRAHQRDHGHPHPADRRGRQGRRPAARPRRVGLALDRRAPGKKQAAADRDERHPTRARAAATSQVDDLAPRGPDRPARTARRRPPHDGTGRVQLSFSRRPAATVRVPPGVSVFDAASWNGIAIDSTCGGHGTCKKCKVQVLERHGAGAPARRALLHAATQLADGWRLACLAQATHGPRGRRAAADHPAQGRHRRRRPAGDPAARRSRSGTSSSTEPTLPTSAPT